MSALKYHLIPPVHSGDLVEQDQPVIQEICCTPVLQE
jgi:hypothetical protein